jgi:hypothetical protein
MVVWCFIFNRMIDGSLAEWKCEICGLVMFRLSSTSSEVIRVD